MVEDTSQLLDVLTGVEFFRGMSPTGLDAILRLADLTSFDADEYLFFQGDPADVFYIVVDGRVKLTQVNEEGVQVILNYPGPGEAFGIVAVLREMAFPVTAQTVEPTRCLAWRDSQLKQMILEYPQLGLNAIRILSKFIVEFQERIKELSTERVEQRVARTLLRLAGAEEAGVSGSRAIDFRLTRQDIAEMSGATLFTISRILSAWEREGLLGSDAQHITLLQPARLQELAEGRE
ncbi:MAG: Crp/Fnr family transcriptional regulator [Anaerolineae bacterium]|nr:MAG: Crp/Fnr family transcriptional regulator [Anaerolineae bacterium]